MTRQDSVAPCWHSVKCQTVAHVQELARAYFKLIDGGQESAGVMDVGTVGADGDELVDEHGWTLEGLQPSVDDNIRLIVRSAFDDAKAAYVTGNIEVLTDFSSMLSPMHQGVQVLVDLGSSDTERVVALSERDDALRRVGAVRAERYNVL